MLDKWAFIVLLNNQFVNILKVHLCFQQLD